MIKKIILGLLLFVLICSMLFQVGCSSAAGQTSDSSKNEETSETDESEENKEENLKEEPELETEQFLMTQKVLQKKSNDNYNDLITTKYDEKDLFENISFLIAENFTTMLHELDEKFPIECLRITPDVTYCIYKTKEDGLVYVFFNPYGLQFVNYMLYSKLPIDEIAFSQLKTSDNISKVESIDASFKSLNDINRDHLASKFSFHMVGEEIYLISYNGEYDKTKELSISEIKLLDKKSVEKNGTTYNFNILTQDYIH